MCSVWFVGDCPGRPCVFVKNVVLLRLQRLTPRQPLMPMQKGLCWCIVKKGVYWRLFRWFEIRKISSPEARSAINVHGCVSHTPLSGVSVHTGVGVIVCSCERVVSGTSNQRTGKGKGSTLFCVVTVLFGADRNKKLLPTRIRDTVMKRQVLLLTALLWLSASVFAQDIIITRDAQRIESKIKEVSPTEIRYLFWDDQDGPVFVLPTSDIVTVIYQNGRVQVFNHDKPAAANEETKSPSDTTDVSGGVIELSGSRLAPSFISNWIPNRLFL